MRWGGGGGGGWLYLVWDFRGSGWQKDKGTRELRSLVQEEVGNHRIFCGSGRQWAWLIGRKGLRCIKVLRKLKRDVVDGRESVWEVDLPSKKSVWVDRMFVSSAPRNSCLETPLPV